MAHPGVVPRVLRLLYLKDAEICDYYPEAEELGKFERTLVALSQAVERARRERDFRPKPSRLCGWCHYQALCPEFGGTPPPFPDLDDAVHSRIPDPRITDDQADLGRASADPSRIDGSRITDDRADLGRASADRDRDRAVP